MPPPPSTFPSRDSYVTSNFEKFQRSWEVYETGSRIKEQDPLVHASCLMAYLEDSVLEVLKGLPFEEEAHRDNADKFLEVLEKFCTGTVNKMYERYTFFMCNQRVGESFDAYVGALRVQIQACNFGDLSNSLLRDKTVVGIRCDETRKKLLSESNLTLTSCIDICCAEKSTESQVKATTSGETSVHKVHRDQTHGKSKHEQQQDTGMTLINSQYYRRRHEKSKQVSSLWEALCHMQCMNHFAKTCSRNQAKGQWVHAMNNEPGVLDSPRMNFHD